MKKSDQTDQNSTPKRLGVTISRIISTDKTRAKGTQPKQRKTPARWRTMASLEASGKDFQEAGIEAGYKASYIGSNAYQAIRQDARYCKLLAEAEQAIRASTVVTRESVLAHIAYGIDQARAQGNLSALKGFLELQGKAIAMYSDKHIVEDSEVQAELDEHKASEAKRLASIRLMGQVG